MKALGSERNLIAETKSEVFSPNSLKNPLDDVKVRENTKTQIIKSFIRSPGKYSNIKYLSTGYHQGVNNMS